MSDINENLKNITNTPKTLKNQKIKNSPKEASNQKS